MIMMPFVASSQLLTAKDSVHFLLDTTIGIMQQKALNAHKVDWSGLKKELKEQTANVKTVAEGGFVFTKLYNELSDVHGAFFYKDTMFRSTGKIRNLHKINAVTEAELVKGPKIVAQMITPDIAFLRIPVIVAQDTASVDKIANRINDSIMLMMKRNPKGIIIDLRLNQGGNMFPMIAGLRSLFKEGIVSDSYSHTVKEGEGKVFFRNDSLITGYYKIKINSFTDYSDLPVAVLIGPSTASAGECTAAALTFRNNTILIGEESMGLTSGNEGFELLPSAGFNLAVSVLKDGQGKILYDCIKPDIEVEGGDNFQLLSKDEKVKTAVMWIKKQNK
ncbi:S41 family peptidase [Lacibacter sediminis]|uniref:S41 family peptidase n=1 Tax=Lacibacter sediminis TaxID=2760713 RepID=UPI002102EE88|nr:S41 family peptidase [Lacibacter sediminis]